MKQIWNQISLNQKLALMAVALGFIGLFAGSPYRGSKAMIDAKELALIVENKVDHVSAEELADWIIQGKSDYRLLDLRTEKEFSEYHIPTAENAALADLSNYPITRNEKIILYSEGGIHSAQAWFLLKAMGFKGVYMLFGGLEEWNDKILFPKIPESPTQDQLAAFNKIKEVSKYFGGSPQAGVLDEKKEQKKVMPKLEMKGPVQKEKTGKKKKEGC